MSASKKNIQDLIDENEQLKLQLADVTYLLELREEEIKEISQSSSSLHALKSKIQEQLYDFEHLQNLLGKQQNISIGQNKREAAMEEELLNTLETEKAYYSLKEQFHSTTIALDDLHNQMKEMTAVYRQIISLKKELAATESNLEIALLDNQFLKEELEQLKKIHP